MAMVWVSISASAYDFEADGIYYLADVSDMTATVTSGDNPYEGDLVIPETTSYKGREFVVTSIASQSFLNCGNLESVKLPESIKTIGTGAFMNCSGLRFVNIPQDITTLPAQCFKLCSSLESINIPSSIIEIGSECFVDCSSLMSISVPNSVTSIGEKAFLNCENLISITLPNTIKILSKELFHNCSKLAEFSIPNSVELIEDGVFENCKDISYISIPANVMEIKNNVFDGCINIKTVKFEDTESSLTLGHGYDYYYDHIVGLFYGLPVEKLYLGRDLSYPSDESISAHANPYDRVYSGYTPFQSCCLSEVTIGNEVTKINSLFFFKCKDLVKIEIPNNVTYIGTYAFACSGLQSFTIDDGFKSIAFGRTTASENELTTQFAICYNLISIKIGRNIVVGEEEYIRRIEANKALFPPTLTDIEIGNYVKEMSFLQLNNDYISESLDHYPNLNSLKVGYCISSLPNLSGNKQLSFLTLCSTTPVEIIDDPISSVGEFTNSQYMDLEVEVPIEAKGKYEETEVWSKFWNLKGVNDLYSNIVVDNDWTYGLIDESNHIELFKIPDEIEADVYIPEEVIQDGKSYIVRSIGNVFKNNSHIVSIDIPETVEYLEADCFKDCEALESVSLKRGLKSIGTNAFQNCISMNNIDLKDGLESIGACAFENCRALQHIGLKDGLKSIGAKAFNNCSSLKTLSIPSSVDVFGVNAFDKCEFDSLVFEVGDTELAFPHSDYYDDGFIVGWGGRRIYKCYFSNVSIKHLYLGRNIKNIPAPYVEKIGTNTYHYMYEDPFYSVSNLEGITIGHNVFKIGSDETQPIYGDGVNNYRSFGGCTHIKTVRVENNNPPINAIFSNNAYSEASLNVPENTILLYQDAEGWKEFENIFDGTEPVLVEEIILNASELSLNSGEACQLIAEVLPEEATDQTVIWESSNPECATVNEDGVVFGVSEGTAIIIVRSADGNCEASCLVTVKAKENSVELIGSYRSYSVYNLQGIKILESDDMDEVKQLPSGVYIVNGKKVIIK